MHSNNICQTYLSIVSFVYFAIFFPGIAHSACGIIPATYPLFSNTELKLSKNISVNGNTVFKNNYKPNAGIDANGNVTTNISLTLPDLDPSSFPSNNSNTELEITSSTTINQTSETFYEKIKVKKKGLTVNFSGGGPFHIGELKAEKENITLNFSAGTYYINKFKLSGENITVNISSSPVIFHIGEEFNIDKKNVNINSSGIVDDFLVYLHSGAKFESKEKNLSFTGLIYGPNNVEKVKIEKENNTFHGAIIVSAGKVEIKNKNTSFIYTAADQTAIGNISTCAGSGGGGNAIPVLNLHMDETSWDGTPNEVEDSSGNNYSGTSYNGANTDQTNPAISGNPGTCGYGEFDGSNDYIEIPHNTNLNGSQALTYMAWINADQWSGTQQIIAKSVHGGGSGRAQMGIFYESGKLKGRAETNNGRTTIETTPPSTNSWHHVALVYSDTSLVLYVDGAVATSTTFSSSTLNSTTDPINISKRVGSSQYYFDGSIDEVRIYTQTLTQSEVQQIMNETHACSGGGGGGDIAAAIFNCVENGADGISGKLYTKTTAQSFSFDIVALQDASTIETSFASGADHTVTVELVNAETVGSCDSYPALSPAVSQSLTMISFDSGIKASAAMNSNTAYKAVKCRVTDATDSPSVVGCSTDSFAIRPTSFSITSSQTNSGSTGLPIAKAGENFTLTATAISGYTGTPVINNANIEAHAGAIQTGSVSGSFNAAISGSGTATGTTFTYSEVGSIRFTAQGIYDNNFTTIDQSGDCTDDFSNTVDGNGKVGCKFGNTASTNYFGRFTPDHFVLSNKNLEDRINLSCNPDSSFTYIGETFQTSFTLTAENSSNNTTQNYTGVFTKLDGSDFNFGAIDLADTVAPISATALSSQLSLVSTSGSWTNGIANMTAILGVNRTIPAGPFESFNLGIAPADSDGITVPSYNLDTSVPSDSNDKELLATTKIRFGRLNIGNAHGSELLALPVPMQTEYYNGTSFIINTDDTCTPISVSQLSFNAGTSPVTVGSGTSTASIANSPLALGLAGLSLSAPSDTGFIDITSSIFISSFPWLNYDWDGDGGYDDPPSARATFGIYKGNSKQIYFREVY